VSARCYWYILLDPISILDLRILDGRIAASAHSTIEFVGRRYCRYCYDYYELYYENIILVIILLIWNNNAYTRYQYIYIVKK